MDPRADPRTDRRDTILVVDDHAEVAKALVALVRQLGYDATAVHDGQSALERVRAARPALVLLDLQMPGVSGFDVLRALRADRRHDDMPVIVCSAAPASQVRDEAIRLGAQDFIAKADAFDELEAAVERHLGVRKAGPPAAAAAGAHVLAR